MTAVDRGWMARRLQQDEARSAAASAERLREELAQVRSEIELQERQLVERAAPSAGHTGFRAVPRRFPHGPARGVAVGVWFVAFYLLLAILASAAPDVPGSADYPPGVLSEVSAQEAGR